MSANIKDLVKIHVEVNDGDLGVFGESVWAKPLGNDLYEIRNSLWHSCDITWGGVVRAVAETEERKPEFIEVVQKSGHRTAHLLFLKACPAETKASILEGLKRWEVSVENQDGQLYAVDVRPEADFDSLCDFLDGYQQDPEFTYRTVVMSADEEELK